MIRQRFSNIFYTEQEVYVNSTSQNSFSQEEENHTQESFHQEEHTGGKTSPLWHSQDDEINAYDDENPTFFEEASPSHQPPLSANHISLNLSWSLMNQVKNMSKQEGVSVDTLIVELLAEAIARRNFEDQMRPAPSHLMTRNGYVNAEGPSQPQLSHHTQTQNWNQNNHQNNRPNYNRNFNGNQNKIQNGQPHPFQNRSPQNQPHFRQFYGNQNQNQNQNSNQKKYPRARYPQQNPFSQNQKNQDDYGSSTQILKNEKPKP